MEVNKNQWGRLATSFQLANNPLIPTNSQRTKNTFESQKNDQIPSRVILDDHESKHLFCYFRRSNFSDHALCQVAIFSITSSHSHIRATFYDSILS